MTAIEPPPPRSAARSVAVPSCLYCGSLDLELLYSGIPDRLAFVPGTREFWQCRDCRSAVQVPLPATEDLPGFYPPVYCFAPELGKSSGFKLLLSRLEYRFLYRLQFGGQVRKVARACGWSRGENRKLLDIGCGRGLRLVEFRRLGFDVHGLDVIPDVVRYLREDLHIPAECADVSEMTRFYAPESFELITTFYMIEHIPDVLGAIEQMYTLLKPGGWLAGAVPLIDSPQAKLFGRRWENVTEAPRHLGLPTREGIVRAYRAAGFEQIRIVPDSMITCAGVFGLSMVGGASTTHMYGRGRLRALAARAAGAAVAVAAIPLCAFENSILGRPSAGIVMGRKPGGDS